jgi:hypothetical protein
MPKFPVDAPRDRVIKALALSGFTLVREGNHIAMAAPIPMAAVRHSPCRITD